MKLLLVNLVAVTHPSGHTQYLDAIKQSRFGLIPSENIENSSKIHRKFKDKQKT
jgi:hypothetical protein